MAKALRMTTSLLLIIVIISGCSSKESSATQSKSLNAQEVEEFAANEGIEVTAHKEIGESLSVIMFNGGFYTAYKRNGEIRSSPIRYGSVSDIPVITAGIATGFPFVTVTINDKELIDRGRKVEVVWEDGTRRTVKIEGHSAVIVSYSSQKVDDKKSMEKISILNEEGSVIYRF